MPTQKSTQQKQTQGTLRPDREKNTTTLPTTSTLQPPPILNESCHVYWYAIMDAMKGVKIFHDVDQFSLAILCQELHVYFFAMNQVQRYKNPRLLENFVQGKQKMKRVNPYRTMAKDALSNIIKLSKEFGFTANSRMALIDLFQKQETEEDPFANRLKKVS